MASSSTTQSEHQERLVKRRRWTVSALSGACASVGLTANEVFRGCDRALKVRQPWLGQILTGVKTLEFRGQACPHVGKKVLLYEVGGMCIRGQVQILGSRLLTPQERQCHAATLATLPDYRQYFAWELGEKEEFATPIKVPSEIAQGSVTWLTKRRWGEYEGKQRAT